MRQRLREELPGAVLEAVAEWKPGQELFCSDKPVVAPGKKSAGRKPRTFRSRVARSIERLGTDRPHAQLHEDRMQEDQMQEDQVSGTAAKTSASSVPVSPASQRASETLAASSKFRKFWDAWVTEAKLGPHEQQIADYLRANPD